MKTIVRLLVEILSEIQLLRASLEKQNAPDVRDQERLDVDRLADCVYSSMLSALDKTE